MSNKITISINNIVADVSEMLDIKEEEVLEQVKTQTRAICEKHLAEFSVAPSVKIALAPAAPVLKASAVANKVSHKTGYHLFTAEKRKELTALSKEEFSALGGITYLAKLWKELTDDEKKVFNDRAKDIRTASNVNAPLAGADPAPAPVVAKTTKPKSLWQQFQAAWAVETAIASKGLGLGDRMKACAEKYKEFKTLPVADQTNYFAANIKTK